MPQRPRAGAEGIVRYRPSRERLQWIGASPAGGPGPKRQEEHFRRDRSAPAPRQWLRFAGPLERCRRARLRGRQSRLSILRSPDGRPGGRAWDEAVDPQHRAAAKPSNMLMRQRGERWPFQRQRTAASLRNISKSPSTSRTLGVNPGSCTRWARSGRGNRRWTERSATRYRSARSRGENRSCRLDRVRSGSGTVVRKTLNVDRFGHRHTTRPLVRRGPRWSDGNRVPGLLGAR